MANEDPQKIKTIENQIEVYNIFKTIILQIWLSEKGGKTLMQSSKSRFFILLLIKVIIVMAFCLFFSLKIQGITKDIFYIPLYPTGSDVNLLYLSEKNIMESGTLFFNARLGAPFTGTLYDFPATGTCNFDMFILYLLLMVNPDIFVVPNIYYVMLPVFIGVITFFVLRCLDTPDWINMGGAVVYAFLPFHFMRNLAHLGLTTYQFVPLSFLLCVWGYQRKIFTSFEKQELFRSYRNWLAVLFCFLIANNGNAYWQAFSCFFLLVTSLLVINDTRKWRLSLSCLIPVVFIVIFFIMALSPSINYQIMQGKNMDVAQRVATESDLYGLKVSEMLIPYEIPGNLMIEENFKNYLDNASLLAKENRTSNLGLMGTVGFVFLLLHLILHWMRFDVLLDLFARLNFSGFLLATVGGLGTVISVFFAPSLILRGYNRISVYIAFLGVAAVCLFFQDLIKNAQGKKYCTYQIAFYLLIFIHFLFLYVWFHEKPDYEALRKDYQNNQHFITAIEASLPKGAMIYQFPYHKFPESGVANEMGDYQLLTGFLHSQKLRWSYGAMKGRGGDKWHEWVNSLPLNKRIKVLSLVGFQGIYVERRAYKQKELDKLETGLSALLHVKPMESEDKKLAFYPMNSFNDSYLSRYDKNELKILQDSLLKNAAEITVKGVSLIERDASMSWRWMDKNVKIYFKYQGKPYDREIKLNIAAGVSPEANLKISINGNPFMYKISNKPTPIIVPAHFEYGTNTIELSTDADKVQTKEDFRSMYMKLVNCDIDVKTLLPKLELK